MIRASASNAATTAIAIMTTVLLRKTKTNLVPIYKISEAVWFLWRPRIVALAVLAGIISLIVRVYFAMRNIPNITVTAP